MSPLQAVNTRIKRIPAMFSQVPRKHGAFSAAAGAISPLWFKPPCMQQQRFRTHFSGSYFFYSSRKKLR
jgi:hypothetical protein